MVVAEIEAFYSRSVAPTRRIALGELHLPENSRGEVASILLGGMMARSAQTLNAEDRGELRSLLTDMELGRRIPQPRLRHRFQADRIGLQSSTSRLVQDRGGFFHLDLDHERGTAAQQALAAVYAMRSLGGSARHETIKALRRAVSWQGGLGRELIGYLQNPNGAITFGPAMDSGNPKAWARNVLGLEGEEHPFSESLIRKAFRSQLLLAHPDHGGAKNAAAERIRELDSARRILISAFAEWAKSANPSEDVPEGSAPEGPAPQDSTTGDRTSGDRTSEGRFSGTPRGS